MDELVELTGSRSASRKTIKDILLLALLDDFCKKNKIKNHDMILRELNEHGIISLSSNTDNPDIKQRVNEILRGMSRPGDVNKVIDINFNRFNKEYTDTRVIGEGMYGDVYHAKNILDGREYAIKKIHLKDTDLRILREIRYFSQLYHPNLVRYHSSWLDYDIDEDGAHTPTIFIKMELCDESLKSWLMNSPETRVNQRYSIFLEIIKGIEYLHDNDMIHRDLKPANILMKNGKPKISDFGLSRLISDKDKNTLDLHPDPGASMLMIGYTDGDKIEYEKALTGYIGTELYASPEQLSRKKYAYGTDIYSLGIIFFELCYHYKTNFERIELIRKLRDGMSDIGELGIEKCDTDLITRMMNPDPCKRPSLNYIKKIILEKLE